MLFRSMQRLTINLGGVDLSQYDLDGPVPDIPANTARVSASASYLTIARREGMTIRQLAMRAAVAKLPDETDDLEPLDDADELAEGDENEEREGFDEVTEGAEA